MIQLSPNTIKVLVDLGVITSSTSDLSTLRRIVTRQVDRLSVACLFLFSLSLSLFDEMHVTMNLFVFFTFSLTSDQLVFSLFL